MSAFENGWKIKPSRQPPADTDFAKWWVNAHGKHQIICPIHT
jgi:hypothetical protein